jgi:hypothetical protein
VPVMPDEVSRILFPGWALGSRLISNVPARDADPVTATKEVPLELMSIWTRLPRVPLRAEQMPWGNQMPLFHRE